MFTEVYYSNKKKKIIIINKRCDVYVYIVLNWMSYFEWTNLKKNKALFGIERFKRKCI